MVNVQPLSDGDPRRLGDYDVTGRLGEGGQGVVYLGRDAAGQVAIKLLHGQLIEDEQARARFVREVEVTKRVARFCTAQVLSAGMAEDRPYIVSEYVPGPSLQRLVRDEGPRRGSALDRLAVNTATALAAIHQAGVVHRDFKPGNVLMGPDGPVVIDFGIARALDAGGSMAGAVSQVVGTPAFMAPEQLADGTIGAPTDMFAWAVTMVYAATGAPAFGHRSIPQVINRILHSEPDLGALDGRLRPVVAACLSKEPSRRPTARQLMDELMGHNVLPAQAPGDPAPGAPGAPRPGASQAAAIAGAERLPAAGSPSWNDRSGPPRPGSAMGLPAEGPASFGGPASSGGPASGGPTSLGGSASGGPGRPGGPASFGGSASLGGSASGGPGRPGGPASFGGSASGGPTSLGGSASGGPASFGGPASLGGPASGGNDRSGPPQPGSTMRLPASGPTSFDGPTSFGGPASGGPGPFGGPGRPGGPAVSGGPPGPPGSSGLPDRPPSRKGRTGLIIGSVAAGLVLVCGIGALAMNGSGDDQKNAAPPTVSQTPRAPVKKHTPSPSRRPSRTPSRHPATKKPVRANPYTPQRLCGNGYRVIETHGLATARAYLLYNAKAGANCVVTMVPRSSGKVFLTASLAVKGGDRASRSGSFPFYAGPIRLPARGKCVIWGGASKTAKWTSGWSHCGN
ncbi:serine/threonine protein kinase [Actinoallomurus sp. CA-142502]|uniref:serine/threonine protein kinase n=1 Tax=Actinoallomurus sp. CA-142502 TaxID=3239885 RepID=UPI003D8A8A5B